jgi:hypothetical protein
MGSSRKRGIIGHSEDSEKTECSLRNLVRDKLCEVDFQGVRAEFQSLPVSFSFRVHRARMAIGNPFKPVGDALKAIIWWPLPPPD